MGWKPWEFERVAHPRDFRQAVRGYQWRLAWELDRTAFIAYHALIAFGGGKKEDGTRLELRDMLGRDLFAEPLIPPVAPDEVQQEEQAMEEAEREAQAERAKLQIYAAMKARQARERGEDPSSWRG
jgi:hypothetical protein